MGYLAILLRARQTALLTFADSDCASLSKRDQALIWSNTSCQKLGNVTFLISDKAKELTASDCGDRTAIQVATQIGLSTSDSRNEV